MLGDELSGLLNQPALRGLIALTCLAGILWILLMIYFAVVRPARRRRAAGEPVPVASSVPFVPLVPFTAHEAAPMTEPDMNADLPDLDLLTNDAGEPAAPPAAPAVPAAPAAVAATGRRLGSADVKLSDGAVIHAAELLVLLRDPRDGRLVVQLGDTGYKSLGAAAGVRASFDQLMRELGTLAGGSASATPPAPASGATMPPAAAVQPPSPTGSGALPGDLPRFTELKDEIVSRGAFRAPKTELPAIPELNIPAAIEAYLQYKKSFMPEYAQRSIHVLPAIGGGVRIEVDGVYYESVGDVTDADVRAFLQTTIQEWQKRQ